MGHRANFVLVRGAKPRAFTDSWAALGATLMLSEGADAVEKLVPKLHAPTKALLDWAFAEGGFLVDYDERVCIAFGAPELDVGDLPEEYQAQLLEALGAFDAGWPSYVAFLADGWPGFTMIWDERGVDAFAEHLTRRGLTGIRCAKPSHPKSIAAPVRVVVGEKGSIDGTGEPKRADGSRRAKKSAPSTAAKPRASNASVAKTATASRGEKKPPSAKKPEPSSAAQKRRPSGAKKPKVR